MIFNRKTIRIGVISVVSIIPLIAAYIGVESLLKRYPGFLTFTRDGMNAEYSSLFATKYLDDLKTDRIFYDGKNKSPIVFVNFRKKYEITIYKLTLTNPSSLKSLIHLETRDVQNLTLKDSNTIIRGRYFDFSYPPETDKINQLFLTNYGDSLNLTIRNDTIVGLHMICKYFSIGYSESGPAEILFSVSKRKSILREVPFELLFLERKENVYLLVMSANEPGSGIPAGLLEMFVMDK